MAKNSNFLLFLLKADDLFIFIRRESHENIYFIPRLDLQFLGR